MNWLKGRVAHPWRTIGFDGAAVGVTHPLVCEGAGWGYCDQLICSSEFARKRISSVPKQPLADHPCSRNPRNYPDCRRSFLSILKAQDSEIKLYLVCERRSGRRGGSFVLGKKRRTPYNGCFLGHDCSKSWRQLSLRRL